MCLKAHICIKTLALFPIPNPTQAAASPQRPVARVALPQAPTPDTTADAAARTAASRRSSPSPARPWTPPPALLFPVAATMDITARAALPCAEVTVDAAVRAALPRRLSSPCSLPEAHELNELARTCKRAEPSLVSSSLG